MLPNIKKGSGIGKTVQVAFGGFDRRPEAGDGTFRETVGMTADRFPVLGSRDKRTRRTIENVTVKEILGMGDVLISFGASGIYYNDWLLCGTAATSPPGMVAFGQKLILTSTRDIIDLSYPLKGRVADDSELPESPSTGDAYAVGEPSAPRIKVYSGTGWEDKGPVIESLEASVSMQAYGCTFPAVGKYHGEDAEWNTILTPSSAGDLREKFKPGDAVTISGCTAQPKNNQTIIVREVAEHELRFYENSFEQAYLWQHEISNGSGGCEFEEGVLYEAKAEELPDYGGRRFFTVDADILAAMSYDPEVPDLLIFWKPKCYTPDYQYDVTILTFYKWDAQNEEYVSYGTKIATINPSASASEPIEFSQIDHNPAPGTSASSIAEYYEDGAVTVSKKWPEKLSGVFADSNRLWGWEGHTLRASKLGDPGNWLFFDGTAEDAWALDVHTPEDFTGGISYSGYPTFFTPHKRYRVYGNEPEAYQLAEQDCNGVKAGCGASLAILNGVLYYVSEIGVMADEGAVPGLISAALGGVRLSNAVCGGAGTKLWVSGDDQNLGYHLFAFDTRNGTWIRDSGEQFVCLERVGETVFGLKKYRPQGFLRWKLYAFAPSESGETFSSTLESNDYTMQQPNRKRVHRVQLRMTVESSASLTVSVQYDSSGSWVQVAQISGDGKKKSVYLPVLPRRCDHFRLKFDGTGAWELDSMALETRSGSAMF